MQKISLFIISICIGLTFAGCQGKTHTQEVDPEASFGIINSKQLIEAKKQYKSGDSLLVKMVMWLESEAQEALEAKPFSVMQKKHIPPSGSKHDFYSVGPYWWPNPDTEDSLPYIRKDGYRNPEYYEYDGKNISKMSHAVQTLALAYFYTNNQGYAQKAVEYLNVWFLDTATYMTPHLNYGQAIPGITQGRGIGIIETSNFVELTDAIRLLQTSKCLDKATLSSLQDWFRKYNKWLYTSPLGWDERMWHNNHGSSYDSQVAALGHFTHNDSIAKLILDSVKYKRLSKHIKPDGSQPHELERTKSMSYSLYNLEHLVHCAQIADNYNIDLWSFKTDSSGSIKKAIMYLVPYFTEDKEWPYEQLGGIKKQKQRLLRLLYIAQKHYNDKAFLEQIQQLSTPIDPYELEFLFYPPVETAEKRLFTTKN